MISIRSENKMSKWEYIQKKIDHLRRLGLVNSKTGGYGKNGGAAPDWLVANQKEDDKRLYRRNVTSNIPKFENS
jgi:hypothetical protein